MKTYLSILFLFFSLNSFGQQFLWTTNKNGLFPNSDMKVISNDEVVDKLKFYYETYDSYYDGTGFTKEGFFKMFETSNSFKTTNKNSWELFKKSITEINLIVNKDNFDQIMFVNNPTEEGYILTLGLIVGFPKFEKFYNSLIEN